MGVETANSSSTAAPEKPKPPAVAPKVWTREGFTGAYSVDQTASYAPDYLSVEGDHAPRRSVLSQMHPEDERNPEALPMLIATSKVGVRLLLSGRKDMMKFVARNVEADEVHFIQHGPVRFETDVGVLQAKMGDFVFIPRGVGYRFGPITAGEAIRSLIIECPYALGPATPYPAGTINFDRDVERAKAEPVAAASGPTRLVLKLADGEKTTFTLPHDPLAMSGHLAGPVPVWRVNLGNIQQVTSLPIGGPPYPFLASKGSEMIFFNLGRRPTENYRPPVHVNADYDEIMLYVEGPAAWGACTEPGTLSWVPKGVAHHGAAPFAEQHYASWLLETRATLKWTAAAMADSELMETSAYGRLAK